jgi:hypothetical protein
VLSLIDGLNLEVDLVVQGMTRSGDADTDGRQPVIVLEGGASTGKTMLMTHLAAMCTAKVPCSFVDLEALQDGLGPSAIPEILATLALQLTRRARFYGTLRFGRLAIGLLAARLDFDRLGAAQLPDQVHKMIIGQRRRTTARRIFADTARDALPLSPGGATIHKNLLSSVADLGADTAARLAALHQHFDWYRHQDNNQKFDPVDQLMELNRLSRGMTQPRDQARAQQLLVSAFLADLRDNFNTGPHADEWTSNCLLLLDNIDASLGRTLLRLLLDVPLTRNGRGGGVPGPVTVVATSRGGLLADFTNPELAAVRDIHAREDIQQPAAAEPIWLRRRLSSLTRDQVRDMVKSHQLPVDGAETVSALVHQIGGGHPGATALLLDAIRNEGGQVPDVEALLASKDTDGPLEDRLRDHLLSVLPANDGAIEALITCSAGRTEAEAIHLLNRVAHVAGKSVLPAGMWSTEPGMHTTILRLLLLRQLARRPDTHPWSWRNAHQTLRAAYAVGEDMTNDDLAGQLHHDLADDKIDSVAHKLTACLDQPIRDWLALLDTVTTAPRRPSQHTAMPVVEADNEWRPHHHSRHGTVDNTAEDMAWLLPEVTSLVVALWATRDPLCGGSRSTLYWRIESSYFRLIQVVNDPTQDLSDRITQYRRLAERWPSTSYLP